MSGIPWTRVLTVRGWLAAGLGVCAVTLLVVVGAGLGFRWDPLGLGQRRLDAARAEAADARADANARRAEQAAEVAQRRRTDAFHEQAGAVDRATAVAISQARSSDDADQALGPDAVRVLRAHDDELRRLAPHLGGGGAPPDPA